MTTIWGPGATEYLFFWHRELRGFSTSEEAANFLREHKRDSSFNSDVRDFLGAPPASDSGARQWIEHAAQLLGEGELLIPDDGGPLDPAWPSVGDFHDRYSALRFLDKFRSNPIAVARLRALVCEHQRGSDLSPLTVDEVFATLAAWLSFGRLIVGERSPEGVAVEAGVV